MRTCLAWISVSVPHAIVLLFLEQQPFQSLRVFGRKLHVPQHHLLYHDAVSRQLFGNGFGGLLADLLPPRGEDFADGVVGYQLAEDAGHHRRYEFFLHRLRQIVIDVVQTMGIQTVSHRDRQPDSEPLFGLNLEGPSPATIRRYLSAR